MTKSMDRVMLEVRAVNAYKEGVRDCLGKKNLGDNPYEYETEPLSQFMQWRNGFLDTKIRENDKNV